MTLGLGSRSLRVLRQRFRRRATNERGYTLIETLIAVWILGAIVVTSTSALLTSEASSDFQSRTTIAEAELRHLSEAVRALPYQECATSDIYAPMLTGLYTPPAGVSAIIVPQVWSGTMLWDHTTDAFPNPAHFKDAAHHPGCQGEPKQDDGVQQIAIWVFIGPAPNVWIAQNVIKRRNEPTG